MHIAEVVTIAKSLPLLRLNTYKSLILSYSADYRRIFLKKHLLPQNPLQRRMYLIRISDYLYVAHYHGNKGFVIIRFCTNRVLCRMMVVDYDYLCSIF